MMWSAACLNLTRHELPVRVRSKEETIGLIILVKTSKIAGASPAKYELRIAARYISVV